jgi:alkylation response protein AidB-like acyl-CoA dehydrogenase
MVSLLDRARRIADEVLFPAAPEVDARGEIPPSHLDLLAEEGFYGLAAPAEYGGPRLGPPEVFGILESLASGCLTTTFTWMQHHGVVAALARTARVELRKKHLENAVRGQFRGGVAFAGAIPRPPRLFAKRLSEGYRLDGEAPFVSGWGIVDALLVSARDVDTMNPDGSGGTVVSGLIDAKANTALFAEGLRLIAAQGTNTVRLRFDGYLLPARRVTDEVSDGEFLAGQAFGLRLNGCVPLGLAGRCVRLLAELGREDVADRLLFQLDEVRARLDAGLADPPSMHAARADAAELAYRAAGTLVAATGSDALISLNHAQRLVREATFTLVAAGRPEIKAELLGLFTG